METEEDLNAKIMAVIQEIQEKRPELMQFLDEMPVTIPNESNPEINLRMLKDYYESLKNLLRDQA